MVELPNALPEWERPAAIYARAACNEHLVIDKSFTDRLVGEGLLTPEEIPTLVRFWEEWHERA